jgi:hypothetical protein
MFENSTIKLKSNITLQYVQAKYMKYPLKIIQKMLRDNNIAVNVSIKLVIAEVIDHLASILK